MRIGKVGVGVKEQQPASVADAIRALLVKVADYRDSRALVILRRDDFDALNDALARAEALEALVIAAERAEEWQVGWMDDIQAALARVREAR
jgi:hypothetical protein